MSFDPVPPNYEKRFVIPSVLLGAFTQDPRIVIKWLPNGGYPLPIEILKNAELMRKLADDKEFNKNYEVVVMPR